MENVKPVDTTKVASAVRAFIVENFLFGSDDPNLTEDSSFLQTGVIDSTGILELVTFVESEYQIRVEDAEMVPENLDSLSNIASFVVGKLS
jgi:acyl carrier protein